MIAAVSDRIGRRIFFIHVIFVEGIKDDLEKASKNFLTT
jgi:hypothetical protein